MGCSNRLWSCLSALLLALERVLGIYIQLQTKEVFNGQNVDALRVSCGKANVPQLGQLDLLLPDELDEPVLGGVGHVQEEWVVPVSDVLLARRAIKHRPLSSQSQSDCRPSFSSPLSLR